MTARCSMILLLTLAACGRDAATPPPPPAPPSAASMEMTPEEHAKMLAGGNQGSVDSLGAVVQEAVYLTAGQERALGVVYTTVTRETLEKTVRTVGTIQVAEPNLVDVTPKVDGFVERLFVNTTGEQVERGQPLLSIYSPALVASQEEFLTAQRLLASLTPANGEAWQSAQATVDAARRRLAYWDIPEAQIARLAASGVVTKTITLVSPVRGIVFVKEVTQGQRIMAGQRLYQLADLREVWVEGEVFEQDLALVTLGMPVHVEIAARPGEHLMGKVSFLYPTVDAVSRTNRVRLTVPNPGMLRKPGMFATVFFEATLGRDVMVVPREAVVVTGTRNLVFVRDSNHMLQPREVVLGRGSADKVEVLSGVAVGETIVASANFLVDAESRLGTSGNSMPGMQHGTPPAKPKPESSHDH